MFIIGVTSCSTGIAHTYMAAGGIEKACKQAGHTCKVETQGSVGIEDRVNQKNIEQADFIIFAADVAVRERERFKDKIIYECGAKDFIAFPHKALEAAISYYEAHK